MSRFVLLRVPISLSFSLLLALPASGQVATATSNVRPHAAQRLDSLMRAAHERGVFHGSALVALRDSVIYVAQLGSADADGAVPLGPEHRFHVGSIGKELSAVGLALLAEDSALSFDDPLSFHLPSLPDWASRVRVRDLLWYTSGLPPMRWFDVTNDAEIMADLRAARDLEFEPGSEYAYNNNDVFLRQRVIEAVSGMAYPEFVRRRLLEPCGMEGALLDPSDEDARLARDFDDERVEFTVSNPMSGVLAVTAPDLYAWTRCLRSGRLISEASLVRLARSSGVGRSDFRLSEVSDGTLAWLAHIGQVGSYEAALYDNRVDDITVVLLTNSKRQTVGSLINAIEQVLKGEPHELPKRSLELALRARIEHHGFDAGLALLRTIERERAHEFDLSDMPDELAETVEYLREREMEGEARRVHELLVERYPESEEARAGW